MNKIKCECGKCKYVSKIEVKQNRIKIETIIKEKILKKLKKKYGKSCSYTIVGSAKRNLIIQKGNSPWDIDYQLIFTSPKYFDSKKVVPHELKKLIQECFQKELGKEYSVKMSTLVIKINLKNKTKKNKCQSFDIALIRRNEEGEEILSKKNNDKSSKYFVKWEIPKNLNNKLYKSIKKIKGDQWNDFRKRLLDKKCKNEDEKPTYSLFLETIKETLES